jgi:AcrR family transcriptional regulator
LPRTGRRPGRSGTREKILAAARIQFARRGYDRSSIRAIAASARVDTKLVQHFYGSKHDLFIAAMGLPIDPTELIPLLLAPGVEGLGGRLVHTFIGVWDSPEGRHLVGLLRSVVGNEEAGAMMREFFAHEIVGRLVARLDIDEPRRRASLVASQLFGLALVRYVVKLQPIVAASPDELARWVGPNVQRYFAGQLAPADRPC